MDEYATLGPQNPNRRGRGGARGDEVETARDSLLKGTFRLESTLTCLTHRTQYPFCGSPASTDVKGPTGWPPSYKIPRRAQLPAGSRGLAVRRERTSLALRQSAPGRSPLLPGPAAQAEAASARRPLPLSAQALQLGQNGGGSGEEWTPLARMVLESVARIVKVQLPAYLKRLPVPESITGFARLTVSEWLRLLPFLGVLALLGYLAVRPFLQKKKQQKDSLINLKIQKENPKVVNEINIEDLCLAKAAYCRCWRSKTFPACDGSHNKHNELTGDNVGPLILKKKEV